MGYLQECTCLPEPHVNVLFNLLELSMSWERQPVDSMAVLDILLLIEYVSGVNNSQKSDYYLMKIKHQRVSSFKVA